MKRSEFLARVRELRMQWHDERFLELADALGASFDPELELLPERLELHETPDGGFYLADGEGSVHHRQRFAGDPGSRQEICWTSRNLSPQEKRARAREAVRRWNVWPHLEALAQRLAFAKESSGELALIQEELDRLIDPYAPRSPREGE